MAIAERHIDPALGPKPAIYDYRQVEREDTILALDQVLRRVATNFAEGNYEQSGADMATYDDMRARAQAGIAAVDLAPTVDAGSGKLLSGLRGVGRFLMRCAESAGEY